MEVNIASIKYDSLANGEGMRSVVFSQGCKHDCKGCFNPHTHEFGTGRDYEVKDLAKLIIDNSLTKKVTFSGGDPFYQAEGFMELANILKKEGFDIWCYTGFTFKDIIKSDDYYMHELLNTIDVLVDGKFEESKIGDYRYRGSYNQNIINVKESLNVLKTFGTDSNYIIIKNY